MEHQKIYRFDKICVLFSSSFGGIRSLGLHEIASHKYEIE